MSYEPTEWVDGDHVTSAKLNKLEQGVNSMSYTPTVWNAGDVVTAEKLNKLEQGVAEGGGGGDFNTAEVTIVNNNNNDVIIKAPMIADYEGEKYSFGGDYVSSGETRKITVVIYGEASLTILGYDSTYTTTGNVEYNSTYNEFKATGDGTITFDA